eukprot:scaffold71636_cov51-Phaeocystis_antarctica.AAC.3
MPPLPPHPPLAPLAGPSPPSQPTLLSTDRSTDLDDAPIDGGEEAISITDNGGFIAGAAGGGALLLLMAAAGGVLYRRRVLRRRATAALRAGAARPPPGAKRRSISLKVSLDRLPGRGSSATVEEPRAPAVPPIKATIHTTMQDPLDGNALSSIAGPIEGRTAEGEAPIPVHRVQLRQSSRLQLPNTCGERGAPDRGKARAEGRYLDSDYV